MTTQHSCLDSYYRQVSTCTALLSSVSIDCVCVRACVWLGGYRHGHNKQQVHAVSLAVLTGFRKILHGMYQALRRHCTVLVQESEYNTKWEQCLHVRESLPFKMRLR